MRLPVVVHPVRRAAVQHRLDHQVRHRSDRLRDRRADARATARSTSRPRAGSPAQTRSSISTGVPYRSGRQHRHRRGEPGGDRDAQLVRSLGGEIVRRTATPSGASSSGHTTGPPSTIGPTGWRWYSNAVAIPKLPPPPRTPQKRSGSVRSSTWMRSPSAVTRSTESRLSTVSPCLRIRWPRPPPSVRPAIPVWLIIPPVVARPTPALRDRVRPKGHPAGRSGDARLRVHTDGLHQRQVDHHPVLADSVAGHRMPATADRDRASLARGRTSPLRRRRRPPRTVR